MDISRRSGKVKHGYVVESLTEYVDGIARAREEIRESGARAREEIHREFSELREEIDRTSSRLCGEIEATSARMREMSIRAKDDIARAQGRCVDLQTVLDRLVEEAAEFRRQVFRVSARVTRFHDNVDGR